MHTMPTHHGEYFGVRKTFSTCEAHIGPQLIPGVSSVQSDLYRPYTDTMAVSQASLRDRDLGGLSKANTDCSPDSSQHSNVDSVRCKIANALMKAHIAASKEVVVDDPPAQKNSSKAHFGWTTIDNIRIPYLLRDNWKYVAVKMVEAKLLSKYPSTYPTELKNRPPLMSHYVTEDESKLLNDINSLLCDYEYGQSFGSSDLIVQLEDFLDFYGIVKKNFPGTDKADGGWLQIYNTVVPYVLRDDTQYVPLSVIRYAAGLLTDIPVEGVEPNDLECAYLSESCRVAGLNFQFSKAAKLVSMNLVREINGETFPVVDLPKQDPFGHAEYCEYEASCGIVTPRQNDCYVTQQPSSSDYVGDKLLMPSETRGSLEGTSSLSAACPQDQGSEINNNGMSSRRSSSESDTRLSDDGALDLSKRTTQIDDVLPPKKVCSADQVVAHGAPHFGFKTLRSPPPLIRADIINVCREGLIKPQPSIVTNVNGFHHSGKGGWLPTTPSTMDYRQRMLSIHTGGGMIPCHSSTKGAPTLHTDIPKARTRSNGKLNKGVGSMTSRHPNLPRSWPREQILLASGVTRPRGRPPKSASSERNKPPPVTTVRVNSPSGSCITVVNNVKITAIPFHGRNISCLVKEDGTDGLQPFVLIEALVRVFFPRCPLEEYLKALENILGMEMSELSEDEEQAFVQYYSCPTKSLKSNKIVKVKDVEECMPQLSEMFRDVVSKGMAAYRPNGTEGGIVNEISTIPEDLLHWCSPALVGDTALSNSLPSSGINSFPNLSCTTTSSTSGSLMTSSVSSHLSTNTDPDKTEDDDSKSTNMEPSYYLNPCASQKRPASTPIAGQTRAKIPNRRIVDVVNRLKENHAKVHYSEST